MSFDYNAWFGIASLLAVAGGVATYFRGKSSQDEKINKFILDQNNRMAALQVKTDTMETWVNIWRGIMEKELPKILIKPHRREIDAYMHKMLDYGLDSFTEEEMEDFVYKMQQVVARKVPDAHLDDDSLRIGYALTIGNVASQLELRRMRRLKRSQDNNNEAKTRQEEDDEKNNVSSQRGQGGRQPGHRRFDWGIKWK